MSASVALLKMICSGGGAQWSLCLLPPEQMIVGSNSTSLSYNTLLTRYKQVLLFKT
jgi:hypothetical protein